MSNCLICNTEISEFINFGKMPIANGFLAESEFNGEYFFTLNVAYCDECKMVQLLEQPDREMMFHDEYAFFSSTSTLQGIHFSKLADLFKEKYLPGDDPFVVELGSNDGILLKNFVDDGIRHLGIEPSKNVAAVAMENGVNTITEFFDETLAEQIISENGHADVVTSANVFCHIPYLHSVMKGIKKLLKPTGAFIFEDPYLGDIVSKTSYDQIYDEHVFFFSVHSVSNMLAMHDMEIFDVQHLDVHGGSMRYFISHKGEKTVTENVLNQFKKEKEQGLDKEETYSIFRKNVEKSRDDLRNILISIKEKTGKAVVAYGATSKSTTVTNYCGLNQELVECIYDTTPIKQGKFSPGAHIPVRPYEEFSADYPEYTLLFAWNHQNEIMAKEEGYKAQDGKWIVYVPEVKVVT